LNNLITVVGITIVALFLASHLFFPTQNAYEWDIYGQGYDIKEIKNSQEATLEEEEAMKEAMKDDDDDDDDD
jgi:hypothetical protein